MSRRPANSGISRLGVAAYYVPMGAAFGLAQLSNAAVNTWIEVGQSVPVTGFLHLTHVRNFGGIFGVQQGKGWIFAAISVLVLSAVFVYVHRNKKLKTIELLCLGLIVGGGLSNVCDRFLYGSVVDYLDVRGIPHWSYVFNAADVLIHLGIWPIILIGLFHRPSKSPAA